MPPNLRPRRFLRGRRETQEALEPIQALRSDRRRLPGDDPGGEGLHARIRTLLRVPPDASGVAFDVIYPAGYSLAEGLAIPCAEAAPVGTKHDPMLPTKLARNGT